MWQLARPVREGGRKGACEAKGTARGVFSRAGVTESREGRDLQGGWSASVINERNTVTGKSKEGELDEWCLI